VTPETTTTQAVKMRRRIFPDRSARCAVCGSEFVQRRSWAQFCSDQCRKVYHKNMRVTGVDLSIRKDIADIKAKLDYLINLGGSK